VTEYEPGDLVLSARAGTSLAAIARVTANEGQGLTLDTPGAPDGSLGVITEATVRLRAKPEVDRTVAVAVDRTGENPAAAAWRWLRASPFTPLAAELCSATLARRIGAGDRAVLLLRLAGNAALATAAERAVAELGDSRAVDTAVWDRLRVAEPPGSAVVRLGGLPSDGAELWGAASATAERAGGFAHATIERGVVRCVVPVDAAEEGNGRLRGMIAELQSAGSRIAERLPMSLWDRFPSPVGSPLSRAIRREFDPSSLLNPGILGDLA
jgi:FAD/FMN-containing dehydrogenase